ncbi:glutathione binding-like protein [Xenorhabdus entomophaga]|uniref:glutathione binding-like protein n=1 Tax=Xenorhabdus entomophaga TaxID=3136257 RepID=UPI003BF59BEF
MSNLTYIDSVLAKTPYIAGNHFTIVDSYLFVIVRWVFQTKLDISGLVNLNLKKIFFNAISFR